VEYLVFESIHGSRWNTSTSQTWLLFVVIIYRTTMYCLLMTEQKRILRKFWTNQYILGPVVNEC
jgi:hypothetical protein